VVREFEDVIPGATNDEETERDVKDSVVMTAFGAYRYIVDKVFWMFAYEIFAIVVTVRELIVPVGA
jgi:hypothetical protein